MYQSAYSSTITVDQSGGGDYTTITAAITAAYAGDVIEVKPGFYEEDVVINKDIDLIGSGPKYTTIQATIDGIQVEADRTTKIANLTITAGDEGIEVIANDTVLIENCVIVGCGDHGVGNRYDNSTITLINNTIAYNNGSGISSGNNSYISVHGNIIVYNGEYGIVSADNNSYNDVYGNNVNYLGCSSGTGDISLPPTFIDQYAGNFALQSTSNCIDSGIPGEPYNDPDGTRNDMGAYSGPNSAAFWPYVPDGPVVTEIQVTPASVPRGGTITIQAKGRVQ